MTKSLRLEQIPVHDVFWDVLDGILQEERITVAVGREGRAVFKRNVVHAVAEAEWSCAFWQLIEARSVRAHRVSFDTLPSL